VHLFFFFQAEDGIRDFHVTGVQTCALPISGLAIQVANGCGLLPRLRHIESLAVRHDSPERRVRYAMQEFATAAPEIPNEMFPAMASAIAVCPPFFPADSGLS